MTSAKNPMPLWSRECQDKFVKSVDDIADYYRKTKTAQKVSIITNAIYLILVIAGIILIFSSSIKGGLDAMVGVDQNALTRKFYCSGGSVNDTLKTYADAKQFLDMYGGTCDLHKGESPG